MELLLLPREDLCSCDLYLQTRIDVDVARLQSLIERLKVENVKSKELIFNLLGYYNLLGVGQNILYSGKSWGGGGSFFRD